MVGAHCDIQNTQPPRDTLLAECFGPERQSNSDIFSPETGFREVGMNAPNSGAIMRTLCPELILQARHMRRTKYISKGSNLTASVPHLFMSPKVNTCVLVQLHPTATEAINPKPLYRKLYVLIILSEAEMFLNLFFNSTVQDRA